MNDALVERVARALEEYGLHPSMCEAIAKAAIEAMGGERVWARKDRGVWKCAPRIDGHVAFSGEVPALLIPLETSDVAE